jgi:hypothetical protein
MRQRSAKPTTKVAAYGITGMIATVLIYLVARYWRIDLPLDVALAAAGILVTAAGGVVAWFVPPSDADAPVPAARRRRDPIGH